MNKLLAGVALSVLASSAIAADLPRRAAAPAPAPVFAAAPFNWSGLYVGASIGGAWHQAKVVSAEADGGSTEYMYEGDVAHGAGGGMIGGVNIGYNLRAGNFVYGVEADFSLAHAGGRASIYDYYIITDSKLNSLGTARLRAGLAVDRALFYVTGGLAYGNVKTVFCDDECSDHGYNENKWNFGYAAGAGLEFAVTQNVTVRGEALYYNLGNRTRSDTFGDEFTYKQENSGMIARVGVNYKFGGSTAPVMARY